MLFIEFVSFVVGLSDSFDSGFQGELFALMIVASPLDGLFLSSIWFSFSSLKTVSWLWRIHNTVYLWMLIGWTGR